MHPLGNTTIEIRRASDIGQIIRQRRLELGFTQQDLAMSASMSRRFISDLEDGKETAQIGKVLELPVGLGISVTLSAYPFIPHEFDRRAAGIK